MFSRWDSVLPTIRYAELAKPTVIHTNWHFCTTKPGFMEQRSCSCNLCVDNLAGRIVMGCICGFVHR